MSIEIRNISKRFNNFQALGNVDLTVSSGELVALLGPSGSGKTTLLRIIAGLEFADEGAILFDGQEATRHNAKERQVGFVFQHYALFRHMTVYQNVAFGLEVKPKRERPSKDEIREKVHELLRLVQLDNLAGRYPAQLSGGQRQRVALARALAVEPSVLLLDEPFGALDARVRQELRQWLRDLHDEIHVTSVFVTHDQEEALEVADRVVVMNRGHIEQQGTPEEVYEHPANPFVFNFLGKVNLFHGRVHDGQLQRGGSAHAASEHAAAINEPAVGYVRSHDIEIGRTAWDDSSVPAQVRAITKIGPLVRIDLTHLDTGEAIQAELTREILQELTLQVGEKVFLRPRKMSVFVGDYQI
ncbi:MAG: sulfate ABC transporter ATP-binding protein [Deltaproteobacteria bacterium]|nr:sulfate ABC transporter ATP-binding protein [Deltaproteobacteria bacterium]TLN02993.1 MAG: sulfate ABC transporter ATP-binding protein [bacterium]